MNRRGARELVLHLIFAGEYSGKTGAELLEDINEENFQSLEEEYDLYQELPPENQQEYVQRAVTGVMAHLYELDDYIEKYAKGWKIERISRVAVSALRLAICEMKYIDNIPQAVSINEAVELVKKYATQDDASFVNGILGSVSREEN